MVTEIFSDIFASNTFKPMEYKSLHRNCNLVVKRTARHMEDRLLLFDLEDSFHLETTFQPFQTKCTQNKFESQCSNLFYFLCLQAEEFSEAVQVVREWLPHAEAELKFKALPEDEDQIVQLIENHEVNMTLNNLLSCEGG